MAGSLVGELLIMVTAILLCAPAMPRVVVCVSGAK
jgi:hypothetical protein